MLFIGKHSLSFTAISRRNLKLVITLGWLDLKTFLFVCLANIDKKYYQNASLERNPPVQGNHSGFIGRGKL